MSAPPPIDPCRCPLCGADNRCGAERGASSCWCYEVRFSSELLEQVPTQARGRACLCAACSASRPAETPALESPSAGETQRR
jgi:hypothetical protein